MTFVIYNIKNKENGIDSLRSKRAQRHIKTRMNAIKNILNKWNVHTPPVNQY